MCQVSKPGAIILFAILLTIAETTGTILSAQDILRLKSGRELKVSVVEENDNLIKYREYENPTGPVYSVSKDKVESVKYRKGSKPVQEAKSDKPEEKIEQPLQTDSKDMLVVKKRFVYLNDIKQNSRNVKTIMDENTEAISLYESGKLMCDLSNTCALAVIVTSFTASTIANKQKEDADRVRISAIGLSIDGAFIITAIILSSRGKKNIRKAVDLYNSSLSKPVSYNFNFGLQENGIGLGITFR